MIQRRDLPLRKWITLESSWKSRLKYSLRDFRKIITLRTAVEKDEMRVSEFFLFIYVCIYKSHV